MNTHIASTSLLLLALALGCKNNAPSTPNATSQPSTATPAPAVTPTPTPSPVAPSAPAAGLERLNIATAASSVIFVGSKVTGSHEGRFSGVTGTIDLDAAEVTRSHVNVTIDMNSLMIEPARLAGHLRSPDLFNVAQFPTATFVTTAIEAHAENGATHTLAGDLTLHGVTHPVRFPTTLAVTPAEVHATASFTINRRDWGIIYPGMPDDLIRDEVAIRLDIHAPRTH